MLEAAAAHERFVDGLNIVPVLIEGGARKQRRVFSQQLLQAFDVVVVNGASSLCRRPLQTAAKAFAHFSGEVLPACAAVFTRDHELRIALRQGQIHIRQLRPRTCNRIGVTGGEVARELLCLFTGGIRETDEPGETSKWSLRPPFMNRLYPAETRLKEGAHAHDSDQNRWECSLAAGGWRPVNALPAVSRDYRSEVKRGESGTVGHDR